MTPREYLGVVLVVAVGLRALRRVLPVDAWEALLAALAVVVLVFAAAFAPELDAGPWGPAVVVAP